MAHENGGSRPPPIPFQPPRLCMHARLTLYALDHRGRDAVRPVQRVVQIEQ